MNRDRKDRARDANDHADYVKAHVNTAIAVALVEAVLLPFLGPLLCVAFAMGLIALFTVTLSSIPMARAVARRSWLLLPFHVSVHLFAAVLLTGCFAGTEYGSAWPMVARSTLALGAVVGALCGWWSSYFYDRARHRRSLDELRNPDSRAR